MSGLEVNTRKLEEIYQEWRGNKSCYDNGRPVFEADELLDFALFCLTHEANDVGTGERQSNIPDVIKSVCSWTNDGYRPPCYMNKTVKCEDCIHSQTVL